VEVGKGREEGEGRMGRGEGGVCKRVRWVEAGGQRSREG